MSDHSDHPPSLAADITAGDAMLDQLFDSGSEARPAPKSGGNAIAKLRYTHDAMIDLLIANPKISQNQIAAHFGYSAPWVSRIFASDAFKSKFAERRKDIIDPALRQTAEEGFEAILLRSQEILLAKLSVPDELVSPQLALKAMEVSGRCKGYGVREPVVTVNETHVHLESLAANLRGLLHREKKAAGVTIEGEATSV